MTLRYTPREIVGKLVAEGRAGALASTPEWPRVRLGDVASVTNGAPYKSSLFNVDGDGMPLIRIRDVGAHHASTWYSGDWERTHLVKHGDLLVGMDGDFRAAHWRGDDALLNQRVCRLDLTGVTMDPRFFFHAIQPYLDAIWAATSSTTVKHLSSRSIADIPLPCPSFSEQQRIVAVLEDHLSRLDAADAYLYKAGQRVDRMMLKSTQHMYRGAETSGIAMRLGHVGAVVTGSTPSSKLADAFGGDVPFLTPGDIQHGRPIAHTQRTLTAIGASASRLVRAPAVAVVCIGAVGRVGHINQSVVTNQQINTISVDPTVVDPAFLMHVIAAPSTQRRLQDLATTTTISLLNKRNFSSVEVPLPAIDVQHDLVQQVAETQESADRVRQGLNVAAKRQGALRRALLSAAFTGRLTGRVSDMDIAEELAEATT